jgi:hypothetical protein
MGKHEERFAKLHADDGFGRLDTFQATLLACLKPNQITRIINSDDEDLRRLRNNSLILPPGFGQAPESTDPSKLRFGYMTYCNAITSVVATRRSGAGAEIRISDADQQLLSDVKRLPAGPLRRLCFSSGVPATAFGATLP